MRENEMWCFKNNGFDQGCEVCSLRYSSQGSKMAGEWPEIDVYKKTFKISFGKKVIAKDFTKYFGGIQERILSLDTENRIIIDFSNTNYINHFCISKILLTLHKARKNKKIILLLPREQRKNKMLRFMYNLGILDYIFENEDYECWIGEEKVRYYLDKYSFRDCYDYAIFPYTIFEENIISDNSEEIRKIIDRIMESVKEYYSIRNQIERYRQVESRIYLYLFEIIDNIFRHAYDKDDYAIFAVNLYNSYLPPYKVLVGTPEERKFEYRIARLQKEVPMSVYKDIQDRYFGGFNIFVDDIGKTIQTTYTASNIENIYRDVYLNGSNKRETINGLKLVADQIATNSDLLWAHDGRCWVSTSFIENSKIVSSDESVTKHYVHPAIRGLTYDLFINLAQNSKEKKRTYERFGHKITFTLDEIRAIVSGGNNGKEFVFVDLLNLENKNKSFKETLNTEKEYLFYRPRATQKNKISNELTTRIIEKFSDKSRFKNLVVYDLNQTTLFQIKAVFEDTEVATKLMKRGIRKVVLLTEESWIFVMKITGETFTIDRESTQKLSNENIAKLYGAIHKNDAYILQENIYSNYRKYYYSGIINWGFREISEYLDIEKMIVDRAIFDVIRKSISRISGMLDEEKKLVFLEKFMDMTFGSLVNEYKDNATQCVYFGSIILSGDTEKRVTRENDIKIYLFKHKECCIQLNESHFVLFTLPEVGGKTKTGFYRRIPNTNRIEACSDKSVEYNYYLSVNYQENIKKIQYVLGFFDTGFFTIKKDDILYNGYLEFVLEILRIKLRKYDTVLVNIEKDSFNAKTEMKFKEKIMQIENDNEFRNLGKHIYINYTVENVAQVIINLTEKIELISMMTNMNHSKNEMIYVPVFNNVQLRTDFFKVMDAGYMPYLPLYYPDKDFFITDMKLEKFYSFARTLNPYYRKSLEVGEEKNLKMNVNFTNEVLNFYEHLFKGNKETNIQRNLLVDVINQNIVGIYANKIEEGLIEGQYRIFIYALLLQHSIKKPTSTDKTTIVNNILIFLCEHHNQIEDSIITYLLLIIMKSVSVNEKFLDRLFDKEAGKQMLQCKSNQLRILFADMYNENCRFAFETELNEFFVSNDITIYYNILAQLLFNSHGTIHDSKLDTIRKKIDENVEEITEADIKDIGNIIPNCISLLKLTKSYDQSTEREKQLEEDFLKCSNHIRDNLYDIKEIIEGLTQCGADRFETINKEYIEEGVREYYNKILNVLESKQYNIKEEIGNLNIFIGDDCETNAEGHVNRNLILYKDSIIFEELSYLLHNAHKHSYQKFSLSGNADKKYFVWVKAELHSNHILLRMFNSIENENKYGEITKGIQSKMRIGKTYLEKFNIHVLYFINPKGVVDERSQITVFETRIEIPYFN